MALFFASFTPALLAIFVAVTVSLPAVVPAVAWLVDGFGHLLQQGADRGTGKFGKMPTVLVAAVGGEKRSILIDIRRPSDAPLRAPPTGIRLNAFHATCQVAYRLSTIR